VLANNITNETAIIIAITALSILAFGTFIVLKKRKLVK